MKYCSLTLFCIVIITSVVFSVNAVGHCGIGYCGGSDIKQCVYKSLNAAQDLGQVVQCSFLKAKSFTALRITFQGTMRIVGCPGGCCRRYYITINGKECTSPATIDTRVYATGNANRHLPGTLDGFCTNIAKGNVKVVVSLGYCVGHSQNTGNAYTGWETVSRLIIEEVPPLQL